MSPRCRGVHSFNFQPNVSAFCRTRGVEGVFRECYGGVGGIYGGVEGVFGRAGVVQSVRKRLRLSSEADECKPLDECTPLPQGESFQPA